MGGDISKERFPTLMIISLIVELREQKRHNKRYLDATYFLNGFLNRAAKRSPSNGPGCVMLVYSAVSIYLLNTLHAPSLPNVIFS